MAEILVLAVTGKLEKKCKAVDVHNSGMCLQFFPAIVANSATLLHFLLYYCIEQGSYSAVSVQLHADQNMAADAAAAAAGSTAPLPPTRPPAMQAAHCQGAHEFVAATAANIGGWHDPSVCIVVHAVRDVAGVQGMTGVQTFGGQ